MKTTIEKKAEVRGKKETRPRTPGALLRDVVVPSCGLTQTEIAARLGVSRRSINMILNEQRPVTVDMAHRLGKLFGNGPGIWLRMQQEVDLWDAVLQHQSEYARIEPVLAA